uniref:Uncharacterized protein n=1 Tax=Vespula pensylvanica TaxID=30213 RepID=A0A834P7G1_VESPE|nr:hypothetical protein H0235_004412 [Vespula pensylvanica]
MNDLYVETINRLLRCLKRFIKSTLEEVLFYVHGTFTGSSTWIKERLHEPPFVADCAKIKGLGGWLWGGGQQDRSYFVPSFSYDPSRVRSISPELVLPSHERAAHCTSWWWLQTCENKITPNFRPNWLKLGGSRAQGPTGSPSGPAKRYDGSSQQRLLQCKSVKWLTLIILSPMRRRD